MNFDIHKRTVYLCLSGSHAYGISTPTSDYDYRGIAIAPMNSYIGILEKFEQTCDTDKGKHVYKNFPIGLLKTDPRVEGNDPNEAPDMQIMELSKFIRLALQNNPSVLETLFTEDSDVLISNPVMKPIIENRHKLLSKSCKARFCGYAVSQLNRIKTHRRWLLSPPSHKPTREEYGLPEQSLISRDQLGAAEALIKREVNQFIVDQTELPEDVKINLSEMLGKSMRAIWAALNTSKYPIDDGKFESTEDALFWGVANNSGFSENFLQVLAMEKRYSSAKTEWDQYQHWLVTRNPKRAEIEKKFGLDLKHAVLLVRLLICAREILEKGILLVKRPEAELLREIRNGAWSYEQIVEFAEKEDESLNLVMQNSTLPKVPDMHFFDEVTRNIILEFNNV
jgi:predicted nucleotidyltransferase